jgi:uncharacterized hydrophobic protein (TIGR00271 family)
MSMNDKPPKLTLHMRIRYYWHRMVKPITRERRADVRLGLRESSAPDFDYFVLVILSAIIATLGLLIDSAAIIIGAMLVAPLMSPIIGLGMASITGDDQLLKDSLSSVLRGAVVAVGISFLVALINRFLPFVILQPIPDEVISRTIPGPIDLGVALAGGAAAAYALAMPNISAALPGVAIATAIMPPLSAVGIGLALGRWDVAGGAFLLFVTNAVSITFAASGVFYSLGFRGPLLRKNSRVPRSLLISAILTAVLLISLVVFSLSLYRTARVNREIEEAVNREFSSVEGIELIEWDYTTNDELLELSLVVRTNRELNYRDSIEFQQHLADQLQRPLAITIDQIFAKKLDPLVPPTPTPSPTLTLTVTPGPSYTPTYTSTATFTSTSTKVSTSTPTSTPTVPPTRTIEPTRAPGHAQVKEVLVSELFIRQYPQGPKIGDVIEGQGVRVLHATQVVGDLVWIKIRDDEGRVGWIPSINLRDVTATPTVTLTETSTPTP